MVGDLVSVPAFLGLLCCLAATVATLRIMARAPLDRIPPEAARRFRIVGVAFCVVPMLSAGWVVVFALPEGAPAVYSIAMLMVLLASAKTLGDPRTPPSRLWS